MTFIIAEIGVNHGGSVRHAEMLVDAAHAAGADAVKFQFFDALKLEPDGPRRKMLSSLYLGTPTLLRLADRAYKLGVEFMVTPFDSDSLKWCAFTLDLKRIKIASGCIGDLELIGAARNSGLPIILSTGMCTETELLTAMVELKDRNVTLMHCVSEYPTPAVKICLQRMQAIGMLYRHWDVKIGFSDHSGLIWPCITAAAMGADVVEAHITLDKNAVGPDHKSSLTVEEFGTMVEGVRAVEAWPENYRLYQELTPEIAEIHEQRKAWRNAR